MEASAQVFVELVDGGHCEAAGLLDDDAVVEGDAAGTNDIPKIGSAKAGRIRTRCGIAHSETLAGLTDRHRAELTNLLRR